jgi:hypothetical protein
MSIAQIFNSAPVPTSTFNNVSGVTVEAAPFSFFERVKDAFQTAFDSFLAYLPEILAALLVLIVGWIIAVLLGKLVRKLLSYTRVDKALDKVGLRRIRQETGLELSVARFVGDLVKWFLIIVSVLAAADILRLSEISVFLRSILLYFPNVVVAVVIVIIGVLVANFVQKLVMGAGRTAKLPSIPLIAAFARWAIIVFSILAALVQLQVAAALIQILFTGIVAMIAIAGGLMFGLGGKDYAQHLMARFRETAEGDARHKGGKPKEPMMGE